MLHTLLLPLYLLHRRAVQAATMHLNSNINSNIAKNYGVRVDVERAFRGDSRSAFAWLDCVLREEQDGYLRQRCAACIVQHVLHSEATIRLAATAGILAHESDQRSSSSNDHAWAFWLPALATAVREDGFWGEECWPDMELRARRLAEAMWQLAEHV